MHITFEWCSLTLGALIRFDPVEGEIEFIDLTCNGFEAGFLLDSAGQQDIYDAALIAARAADRNLVRELQDERAADRAQTRNDLEDAYA